MQTVWTDGQVTIRPYQPTDAGAFYQAARESITEVYRWLPWCHPDYALADSEAWLASRSAAWASGEAYSFAVIDARDGAFLGGCGLNHLNAVHQFANIGYWVRTSQAGRGVAVAATRLVAQFGLRELGLQRLEIVVDVDNRASQRVAEKVGATHEGVLRKRLLHGETCSDAVIFSLTVDDLVHLAASTAKARGGS